MDVEAVDGAIPVEKRVVLFEDLGANGVERGALGQPREELLGQNGSGEPGVAVGREVNSVDGVRGFGALPEEFSCGCKEIDEGNVERIRTLVHRTAVELKQAIALGAVGDDVGLTGDRRVEDNFWSRIAVVPVTLKTQEEFREIVLEL